MSDFDLVDDYFCKVCDYPDAELTPETKALVDVWHSFGLIENGGIHGYISGVGSFAKDVAHRYRSIDLVRSAELIEEAYSFWKDYCPSMDVDDSDPDEFRDRYTNDLDRVETEFYELESQIQSRLASIVRTQTGRG